LEQGGRLKIRLVLAAIALAGGAALASACRGDGEALSLEEYLQKVEELSQAEDNRSGEIEEELDALGQDATPGDIANSFEQQLENFSDFVDGMSDVEPPSEVEDTHEEAVEALQAAVDDFDGLVDDLAGAESIEDVSSIFEGIDESNFERATQACHDLQGVADDNDISVDLRCEELDE
jgi:hypothetical protein